ncbi:MAG: 23S rRNA (adenine(2503)-C(2))-methyltransferase RlmN [Bacteroidota bacterium]
MTNETLDITPSKKVFKNPGKPHVKGMSIAELEEFLKALGEPRFRAEQVFRALYSGAESFKSMAGLPAALREKLEDELVFKTLTLEKLQKSDDGTHKFLFTLPDGGRIESVLIPSETVGDDGEPKRMTLCVSTQVGCPLGCKFCATASLKVKRNLSVAEIVDQLLQAQKYAAQKITNMVFMGMGEPMLNYDNVMSAVEIFTHPKTELLSPKRITLSTAGMVDGIKRMADENRPIKLALSLHATTNGLRQKLMPIAKKYDLKTLMDAIEYYYRKTRRTVTYEYILFEGVNDSPEDAQRLAKITRRVPSKVNVIPFHAIEFTNPTGIAAELKPTSPENFKNFIKMLQDLGTTVMIRSSSGEDIDAACGQLAFSPAVAEDATVHLHAMENV